MMTTTETKPFKVVVHFATSHSERIVSSFDSLKEAEQESRRYLMADARGVWVEWPDGSRDRKDRVR